MKCWAMRLTVCLLAVYLAGCVGAQLPEKKNAYTFFPVGQGFFVLPAEYQLEGDPTVSPYPDDEICFTGVYTDLWQPYSLKPLQELRQWLKERGVELLIVLYPDPWEVSARMAQRSEAPPPTCSMRAAEALRQAGLHAIDTTAAILATADAYPLCFYYDALNDIHPEAGAVEAAAQMTAAALAPFPLAAAPQQQFTLEEAPTLAERFHPLTGSRLTTTHVLLNGVTPPLRAPDSPVLVIGNSISATPYTGEFAARLGRCLGVMPDYLRCDGDGIAVGMPRRLATREQDYLHGKKVVVLVSSYPQLFYRWHSIAQAERLAAFAGAEGRIVMPEEWRSRLLEVRIPQDGWMAEFSRIWRGAEQYTEAERSFQEEQRDLHGELSWFKSGAAGNVWRFSMDDLPADCLWKLSVATTAPPGYLHVRAGTYETTLNDYSETWYFPGGAVLELEADLPECVIGLGEMTVYPSSKASIAQPAEF